MIVCKICGKNARWRITLDCGRFKDKLFFCDEHKPQTVQIDELNEKKENA